MESPEPGTLNIFSMASLDNGNGPNTRRTIGAIILACPCIIATTLSKTISWRIPRRLTSAAADHCNLGHTVTRTFVGSLGIWGTWRTLANGGTLELFGRDPDPHEGTTYVS